MYAIPPSTPTTSPTHARREEPQPEHNMLGVPGTPTQVIPEVPGLVELVQPTASLQVRWPPVDPPQITLSSAWEFGNPEEVNTSFGPVVLSNRGSRQDPVFAPSRNRLPVKQIHEHE